MKKTYSIYFVSTVALFITSLLTANIISVKLFIVGNIVLTCGVIIFPISYIVGDVLTEVYGFKTARKVIFLGFACNLLMVLAIYAAQMLPAPVFWDGQEAYQRILGFVPRLVLASFIAYIVGEIANSFVMDKMKIWTQGKHLWMRTIGSTIIGQGLDSLIFIGVAFWGHVPPSALISMILIQWGVKTGYEALVTPLTYKAVSYIQKKENALCQD